jgi:F-type H+-transporting ATPase subunit epsilon
MMSGGLTLRVTTPLEVAVDETDVASIRAEDASGGFGILPGHADFLTVLSASVLRWRAGDGIWHYCALRGGVLRVRAGSVVEVAVRDAVVGPDLSTLEALVNSRNLDQDDASRSARAAQIRLHANAIRGLMKGLNPSRDDAELAEILR